MNNYHNYYITIIIIIFSIYEVHNSFFQDKKNSFFFPRYFSLLVTLGIEG